MNWYIKVLKQYADFNGRTRRKEYWMFALFNTIFAVVAMILDNVLGITIDGIGYGPLYGLYTLAILVPSLAVVVRRLHDIGKNGWMVLIGLIPLVGALWLLILLIKDSDPDENEYGENPKDVEMIDANAIEVDVARDRLILIIVIFMLVSRTFEFEIIARYVYMILPFDLVTKFMELVWALIPLAFVFMVKNRSKQMLLFILAGIYMLIGFYKIISTLPY